ncbi:hypothetical protein FRC01_012224, partial [Tulasnella sp. 417]
DAGNTGTVFSTTTVPDFAPDPPAALIAGQPMGRVNKRRLSRRDMDSFVDSESDLRVDLDRWE